MKSSLFRIAYCALLFIQYQATAQVAAVKFIVNAPAVSSSEKIYLAGSFNFWHTPDSLYQLQNMGNGLYTITIPVFEGIQYYYKYTLGDWNKVELAANDSDIDNRTFISANKKKINDTIIKWRQPTPFTTDSSEQLKRITAMKDSLVIKLKPELEEIQGLLKLYVQNMLQQTPDKEMHAGLDEKVMLKIGSIYRQITLLIWNIVVPLKNLQKEQIAKAISNPSNGDFLNTFLNSVNVVVK